MYANSVSSEDIGVTHDLIKDSIEKNRDIEWRSQKEFLEYLKTSGHEDWRVIGYITSKTLKKWGMDPEIKNISSWNKREEVIEMFWILIKGNEHWFIRRWV